MKSEKLLQAMGEISDDLILAARPAEKKRRPRVRMVLVPAAAVLLVLTLAIGVGAATDWGSLENLFGPVFPGAQSNSLDPALLEKLGSPVGVSAADNGVTVTVDSMIRDRYNCTLVVTVEKDGIDGQGILFNETVLQVDGMEFLGGSSSSDPVSGDGKVTFVVFWSSNAVKGSKEEFPTGKAAVILKDLVVNLHVPLLERTIEGTWELELDLDYEDLSVELPAGQTLFIEGMETTIDSVTVSPLSIFVTYTVNCNGSDLDRVMDDGTSRTLRNRLGSPDIVLTKKDGARFADSRAPLPEEDGHIRSGGSGSEEADGKLNCCRNLVFDQPIPLEELESVTIEGIEIPVDGLAADQ